MGKRQRSLVHSVIFLLVSLLVWGDPISVFAWDAHDLITTYSLNEFSGLAQYDEIEITPYTYAGLDDSRYNPDFKLEYRLGEIGDKVSAFDILSTYAPEPDWDLDKALELSPGQKLTGGSQGWRHQRYTLLGGIISLGVAPERAQHFYDLALVAFDKGDRYWGFRFLARSIHYLQDLSQPLHALPLPISDFIFKHKFNVSAADSVATNVHYSIESYYDHHLRAGAEQLVDALEATDVSTINSVEKFAAEENKVARKKAGEMYRLVLEIWPELNTAKDVRIAPADYGRTEPSERLQKLWTLVEERLSAAGNNTRGLVAKFLHDVRLAAH